MAFNFSTQNIKLFVILLIVFVLLDLLWINYFSSVIIPMIEHIQNKPVVLNIYGVVLAYFIMVIAYYYIAFDDNNNPDYLKSLMLGLAIYGTYEFTNYATFNDWKNHYVVALDISWGLFISAASIFITSSVYNLTN